MSGVVAVIVSDLALRRSIGVLLEAEGRRAETYASPQDLISARPGGEFGCMIFDGGATAADGEDGLDGFDALRGLDGGAVPVIVLGNLGNAPAAARYLMAGAVDFLSKPFSPAALLRSVDLALAQTEARADGPAEPERRLRKLTPREQEVLDRLVEGNSAKAIANALEISPRTVEVHRARIMDKFMARNLADLVRIVLTLRERDRPAGFEDPRLAF